MRIAFAVTHSMVEAYPATPIVVCADPARMPEAAALAAELGAECIDCEPTEPGHLVLRLTGSRLELQTSGDGAPGPVFAEFVAGDAGWRGRHARPRDEALARAAGVRAVRLPSVIDATAGLGRDAFVLAALGCEVTLIERHPAVVALLRDALQRAAADHRCGTVVQRMHLVAADARAVLADRRAEIVLVDPMHPPRRKGAAVKKEMRALRRLVGDDADAVELLAAALAAATRRVVVKRPRGAEPIPGPPPSGAVEGRSTRFDIYAGRAT